MHFLADPQTWIDLLILTILEIVLGIDNIVFLVLATNRLPSHQQVFARRIGLALAMLMRLALLGLIFWLAHLTVTLFSLGPFDFSIRDLVELAGGLFLLVKSTQELYYYFSEHHQKKPINKQSQISLWVVLLQVMLLDVVFSVDSVITAVAIAEYYTVMAAAIIIAIIVMMLGSEPVNYFINRYVRLKLLALILILLVSLMLICHSLNWNVSEWYLYIAIMLLGLIILPPWKRWLGYKA